MRKSVGSYALLLVFLLAAVTCLRSEPASKTPSAGSLGQSPAAFASELDDALLNEDPITYEGPCVDGQHNVEHCGDCLHVNVWLDARDSSVGLLCTQCRAGLSGNGAKTAPGSKVHDLGSITCHWRDRYRTYPCVDGEHGVDSCGSCSDVAEIVNSDNTTTIVCNWCRNMGARTWNSKTLAEGQTVANLGDFGCSPVKPFVGQCIDGEQGVNKCGSCSLMTTITNYNHTKEIKCLECSSGHLSTETIKISKGEFVGSLGAWACDNQPPHDYEGPCRDGKNNIEKCGACQTIKTSLRVTGKTEVECTACSTGNLKSDVTVLVKEGATVADMGANSCEPPAHYAGVCQDGQHHVNSCGSCQAISVVTNLDHSVHVQCTQCRPNGKKDHIKRGDTSSVPDLGEFGCHF